MSTEDESVVAPVIDTRDRPAFKSELTMDYACDLATYWYSTYGPYRNLYKIKTIKGYQNSPREWSIKFKVIPDTGILYFRRFHYAQTVCDQGWEVTEWSEDPELPPEADFDPDEYQDEDDLETLEEEEEYALENREDGEEELNELNADNELSVEDLMAKYGISAPSYTVGPTDSILEFKSPAKRESVTSDLPSSKRRRTSRRHSSSNTTVVGGGSANIALSEDAETADNEEDTAEDPFDAVDESVAEVVAEGGDRNNYSRLNVLNYFNASYHEEETEIESGTAEKKTSRVGEEYQCYVPDDTGSGWPKFSEGKTAIWAPAPPGTAATVDNYCSEQMKINEDTRDLESERILQRLFSSGFDTAVAVAAGNEAVPELGWLPDEVEAFERGLSVYGKNFYAISETIPSRCCKEVVQFYYEWKTTPMYCAFVRRCGGFGGKVRAKHTYEPGNDVTLFKFGEIDAETETAREELNTYNSKMVETLVHHVNSKNESEASTTNTEADG